jgi:hypothetical protein
MSTVERSFDGKTFENLPSMPEEKNSHCLRIVDDNTFIVAGDLEKSEWKL